MKVELTDNTVSKFKIGDLVYCPQLSLNILKVKKNTAKDYYQLYIEKGSQRIYFCESGVIGILSKVTPVIHATQENYESLSRLYPNVEFEKPPVRKTSREVIQAMLDDWGYVVCCVSDSIKSPDDKGYTELVYGLDNNNEYQFIGRCNNWRYATPFDPKTGKVIVDYVNGEIVTE